ncbi:MAG: flagellar biosynthetic protein FliR [Planctomycetota bacterium]
MPGTLEAFGLYATRSSAMVVSAPILGVGTRFSSYKIGLIALVSLLMYGVTGAPLDAGVDTLLYAAMMLREVLLGLFLSFVLHLAMLVVRVSGHMIGQEMGFLIAQQVDPATGVRSSLITTMYESIFLLGLLALNGHFLLFRALADSYERAPIGGIEFSRGFTALAAEIFGDMFAAGLVFAAPVMVLLVLVSALIGLLSRAVPHLNILEIGFSIRILLSFVAMFLFAPLLAPAIESVYDAFARWLDAALVVMEG